MIEVAAKMLHPRRIPQIISLLFNRKFLVLDKRYFHLVIGASLVFLSLTLVPSYSRAQPHLNMNDFQLPPEAKGDFYYSQGKFKDALEVYKSVLQDKIDVSSLFRKMVKAWDAMGALDEAQKFLNDYLQSHEKSSGVSYGLGFIHYLKNEDQLAEELFRHATELDPDNGLAWNNWAAVLSNQKYFQDAVEKVRNAIRSDSKELMFFFNLKKIYDEMGEGSRFEEEFKENLNNREGSWGYGKVLARFIRQESFREYAKGNITSAIAGFEKILNIYQQTEDVKGQVPALFSLGLLHEESGNSQKSQEFFRQLLAINPDHKQARDKIKPLN